jgi:ABC-type transporter Mla maintaining outer membrane lipid asymmetry ATPase subunit MlaF
MSPEPLLEFRGVRVAHSQMLEATLFEKIDWRVVSGDFWVVGSTQGSGKSALLELASARCRPSVGEVRLFGEAVFDLPSPRPEQLRRRVGMVFDQDGRVFTRLTVAENIALPLRYHREISLKEALGELKPLIEAAELGGVLWANAGRISRGWGWRTACVRALALLPELLLLDNPMSGLDRDHARWCRGFVSRLATEGIGRVKPLATVVVCDDLRPWVGLGHQFALASGGKWEVLGGREAVLKSAEPAIRDLLQVDY